MNAKFLPLIFGGILFAFISCTEDIKCKKHVFDYGYNLICYEDDSLFKITRYDQHGKVRVAYYVKSPDFPSMAMNLTFAEVATTTGLNIHGSVEFYYENGNIAHKSLFYNDWPIHSESYDSADGSTIRSQGDAFFYLEKSNMTDSFGTIYMFEDPYEKSIIIVEVFFPETEKWEEVVIPVKGYKKKLWFNKYMGSDTVISRWQYVSILDSSKKDAIFINYFPD